MSLKILSYNKSVVKSDFKRFWWISALNTLFIALFFTFIYVYAMWDRSTLEIPNEFLYSRIHGRSFGAFFFAFVFPPFLAILTFSYLNSSNSVACLHGLPVTRLKFFMSHFFSSSVMIALPIVINVIIMLLFRLNDNIRNSFLVNHLFILAGIYLLYAFISYTFAAAVSMLTGNSIAAVVFTYSFAVLPVIAEIFVDFFCSQQLYGYKRGTNLVITDFLYVFPDGFINHPSNILKYIILILLFAILAYFLYRIRKLENSGEVVAFPKLHPIFIYGVAIIIGAAGYAYLSELTNIKNILFLIPLGVVGVIAAQMIVKKSFRVKKLYKPVIIFSLAVCVLQLFFQLDIIGFERRIPKLDKIESVLFENNVNTGVRYTYTNDGEKIKYESENRNFQSKEDIENIIKLHQRLIEERTTKNNYSYNTSNITLAYELNNGKRIVREYTIDYSTHKPELEPIIESENMRRIYFPILSPQEKNYEQMKIHDSRKDVDLDFFKDDTEIINKFLWALSEDTKATDYENFARRTPALTTIRLTYTRPAFYEDGAPVPEDKLPEITENYHVREDYKNTIALLDELGFYDMLPKAEDIKFVHIEYYDENMMPTAEAISIDDLYKMDIKIPLSSNVMVVEQPDRIKMLYEYIDNFPTISDPDASMIFYLDNNNAFSVEIDLSDEKLPDFVIQ